MKLFVWDFHGVLEKDNEYAVQEVCNKVLPEFGITKEVTLQECRDLYGQKWAEYFRYFAPNFGDSKIFEMVDRAVAVQKEEDIVKKHIKPQDHAHDVLEKIALAGHMNILMSNSNQESLDYFLESVNMSNHFTHKYAADRHQQNAYQKNSKAIWLNSFLKNHSFDKRIVIDDSLMGIEMGKRIGAVTYHFNRDHKYCDSHADYQIDDLREILREV